MRSSRFKFHDPSLGLHIYDVKCLLTGCLIVMVGPVTSIHAEDQNDLTRMSAVCCLNTAEMRQLKILTLIQNQIKLDYLKF